VSRLCSNGSRTGGRRRSSGVAGYIHPQCALSRPAAANAETFAAELVAELELRVAPAAFLESFAGWPTGLYPGTHELIARIPGHVTRALLSNSNSLHWPRVEDEFGLRSLFEHRFVSHLTGRIKPDRDAFEHVVSSLGCDPGSVFFLDDNLMNVEAAQAVGMQGAVVRGIDEAERALRHVGVVR